MPIKYRESLWMNYFKPTVFIKSFSNLNLFALRRSGIKLLICDLDNTISPHFARFPNRKAINFCKAVQNTGIKLAIVSNNTYKRVNNWVNRLKTEVTPDYVIPSAKKPLKRKVLKMIKHLGMKINETAIMGDQFVIDVWLANRIGCISILVLPIIDPGRDESSNRLIRFLDRFVYQRLEHINYLPVDREREGDIDDAYQIV